MQVFRIRKTASGWALFKQGSSRPVIEAACYDKLVALVSAKFKGKGVAVRVPREDGAFQEIRL